MDKASVYGTGDCRFESYQGQLLRCWISWRHRRFCATDEHTRSSDSCISGLVVEYIVAIDVTRVRFPADARFACRDPCHTDGSGHTLSAQCIGFIGLVVITLASHARGPQFNPGMKYFCRQLPNRSNSLSHPVSNGEALARALVV